MDSTSIIGFVAATFTTLAFLPQMLKTIKYKETKDISLIMYIVFVIGISFWLVYGVLINSYPIILANIVSFILAFIILLLKLKYK